MVTTEMAKKASKRRGKRKPRRWRRWVVGMAVVAVGGLVVHLWMLHRRVDGFLVERSTPPLLVYSDSFVVQPGMDVEGIGLRDRLLRLGYEETHDGRVETGRYRRDADRFVVGLRAFRDFEGDHPARTVGFELSRGVIRDVRRADGGRLRGARLDPELLGSYAGGVLGERQPVALESLPPHVVEAVLAIEDARFARHPGLDPVGLLRAAIANFRGGRIVQGGSTITQQLAKNLFLTPERGWIRKANEAALALMLEARLSKTEILELYLNNVYLGRTGTVGIYGVARGARAFFAKEPQEISLAEAATLAGVIHSPNATSPVRHPDRARARRDQVLALMLDNGWIDESERQRAAAEPLHVRRDVPLSLEAPFFVDEVLRRVRQMGYEPDLVRGLSVYTAVDVQAQRSAERVLAAHLAQLEKTYAKLRRKDQPLEGAVVLLEARTGFVRALVGGRDFSRSQFNRVTRSRRQPGSAFKPFVYLAALDDPGQLVTPSTLLVDEPLRLRVGNKDWAPANYDGRYLGEITVRSALEGSRNVPTVQLARRVGLERIASLAKMAGLRGEPVVPAMALGASEVSLLRLVSAYTVFPNLGEVVRPALIRGIVAQDGRVLYGDDLRRLRVATAPASYVTSHLLEGVVNSGTGASVRRLGLTAEVAGKTGTTNEARDAWFVGYSPDWVAGVWVGFDDSAPIGLTGATAALPVWVGVMRDVLEAREPRRFAVPPGVVFRDVDRASGLIATWSCPESVREAFLAGTEPLTTCEGGPARRASPERDGGLWGGTRGTDPTLDPSEESRPRQTRRDALQEVGDLLKRWFGGR